MEYKTIAGNYYTITSKSGCSVTDATGTLSMTVDAGGQLTVQAPSDKLVYDDEQAIIFKANFKSAPAALSLLGGGDKLPAGYTPLEFLESTGTQYIDTGIVPTAAAGLKIDHELTNDVDTIPLGCRNNGSSDTRFYALRAPRKSTVGTYLGYGWGAWQALNPNAEGSRVNSLLNWLNSGVAAWQGTTRPLSALPFTPTYSLYMFAANIGGKASLLSSCRVWTAAVSKGDSVMASFIPALDATGTPCMFDLVSRKPFYNSGAGDFTYPNMEQRATTYSLRRPRQYAQMTERGIRRLYHVPKGCNLTKEEYAEQNGFKILVETPAPDEGYWAPVWHEREDCIELEWVETEPPAEELSTAE